MIISIAVGSTSFTMDILRLGEIWKWSRFFSRTRGLNFYQKHVRLFLFCTLKEERHAKCVSTITNQEIHKIDDFYWKMKFFSINSPKIFVDTHVSGLYSKKTFLRVVDKNKVGFLFLSQPDRTGHGDRSFFLRFRRKEMLEKKSIYSMFFVYKFVFFCHSFGCPME